MNDAGPITFALHTPDEDLAAHVAHALSLGLPEADCEQKNLHFIANGPSSLSYNFDAAANWHHYPEAQVETATVNGGLKLFTDRGMAPTYWLCCDPQELVATDFLSGVLPEETIYMVASKCHPSVFERLKDRKVVLWHVNDVPMKLVRQVPCAVSVTLCALMLFHRLMYRRIDAWGWDLCFAQDGTHHGATGDLDRRVEIKDLEIGEGDDALWFKSTPPWCAEITDATGVLPVLKWCGTDVVIHGGGMLGAIIPVYSADTPRMNGPKPVREEAA